MSDTTDSKIDNRYISLSSAENFSVSIAKIVNRLLIVEKPLWFLTGGKLQPSEKAAQMVNELLSSCPLTEGLKSPLKLIVGVSGGADSTSLIALLALLSRFFPLNVEAAHVAYNLRGGESGKEVTFLIDLCQSLNVPLHIHYVGEEESRRLQSGNLQAVARDIRRTYFKKLISNGAYLCLGHILSDNCETLFLRLLSGSGLKGLSSMRLFSTIDDNSGDFKNSKNYVKRGFIGRCQGVIIRPLLDIPRRLLEKWLKLNFIDFCEDSSNGTDKYKRNKIRHHLIPALQAIEPSATSVINQSIKLLAVDSSFLEDQAEVACKSLLRGEYCNGMSVSCSAIHGLHKAISSRVIRCLIETVGLASGFKCSHILTEEILEMVQSGKSAAFSSIRKHINISLYRGRIYVFPIEAFNPFSLIINYSDQKLVFEKSTGIKNAGELQSVTTDLSVAVLQFVTHHWSVKLRISSELPVVDKKNRNYEDLNLRPMIFVGLANDKSFPLEIRTFNGVDRLSCTEGITKKVSSILSEKGVPKHLRRLWPLILLRNNITWVGGFRCSSPFSLNENNGPFLIIEISSCE